MRMKVLGVVMDKGNTASLRKRLLHPLRYHFLYPGRLYSALKRHSRSVVTTSPLFVFAHPGKRDEVLAQLMVTITLGHLAGQIACNKARHPAFARFHSAHPADVGHVSG